MLTVGFWPEAVSRVIKPGIMPECLFPTHKRPSQSVKKTRFCMPKYIIFYAFFYRLESSQELLF